MSRDKVVLILFLLALNPITSSAQQQYQHPPKEILEVLNASPLPIPITNPPCNAMILASPLRYPPISDLAEPMLPLAGVRINPKNNALHGSSYYVRFSLKKLPDGEEITVELPSGARAGYPQWNSSGTLFAFTNTTATGVELWIGETATGKTHRLNGIQLNPVLGSTMAWMPDMKSLLVKRVSTNRGQAPAQSNVPAGPLVEDSGAVSAASSTYETRDLLKTPYDADLFQFYATAQLSKVDVSTGAITDLGSTDVFAGVETAPGGSYILIRRIRRPYSFLRTYRRFPADVELWDASGKKKETLASLPAAEQVPIGGVETGPRDYSWRLNAPATLVWIEALDDGDSYKKVPYHDRIMIRPVDGSARELMKTEQRLYSMDWIEGGHLLITEYDDDKHWLKTFLLDTDARSGSPRLVWSLNSDDSYHNPGYPVYRMLENGAWVVRMHQDAIFMQGMGASPEGNRPFLDRLNLSNLKTERLFRSSKDNLESFYDWIDPATMSFLTTSESPTDPPNVFLRTIGKMIPSVAEGESSFASTRRQLTKFTDPVPQLRQISKQLVTYKRPDGVELSFILYLPPGYKQGTPLPTIVWAYPLDYTEASAAGQVVASPQEFTWISGASPIFFALQGYAVLDETAMPVVGPSETAYNSFIEQIIANAKAAIDKAVELGVTDPNRVGVAGHSHGALMTANLIAWSDLFRAGIARSGAYNHTLRPFGFQNERRTLYKAAETYFKLSPLIHADKINEPLLIIHGERDANPGTVTLQSQKLFEAIRGVGGTARLVLLPLESHGYAARESVEHALYEMFTWFDRYVKNAQPKPPVSASQKNS